MPVKSLASIFLTDSMIPSFPKLYNRTIDIPNKPNNTYFTLIIPVKRNAIKTILPAKIPVKAEPAKK